MSRVVLNLSGWLPEYVAALPEWLRRACHNSPSESAMRYIANQIEEQQARPLVVIDPEDRKQVERLTNALDLLITSGDDYVDGVQAALREFANPTPPKPEEPTGLGAVVEDGEGNTYTRADRGGRPWLTTYREGNHGRTHWLPWYQIDAVKVLSEGVQP